MSLDTHLIVEVVMEKKKWLGSWPASCDICTLPLDKVEYFVDGRVTGGTAWALMCPVCHYFNGVGLGTGRGQKYDSKTLEKLEG